MTVLGILADIRDVVIIVYGALGIVLVSLLSVLIFAVYRAFRGLQNTINELIDDSVKPTLTSIRETAETVKGTTEFVGQTAVSPIIRTYGMVAGVRRGLGVLAGLNRRKEG
ncbi:MAG TPA: hypothetical protein VNN10_05080 [Dehalococcoidia bacterium]|jgi:hypothetical protein|nr:hypothetical protein [Dehalococcoidia bacterium]